MRVRLKVPWFAQDAWTLRGYLNQRVQLVDADTVQAWDMSVRQAICDVLVDILKGIELEIDITPDELTKLDVQVLEHVATELMGKVAARKS